MTTPQFDDPAEGGGIDLNTLLGRLLLIKPDRVEVGVPTVLGAKDATVADVHVLDGPEAGKVIDNVFLWPKVLQNNIRTTVGTGRYQLGRLGQGVAKPGQNPPWKLIAGDDAERAIATRYLAQLAMAPAASPVAEARSAVNEPRTPTTPSWAQADEPPF